MMTVTVVSKTRRAKPALRDPAGKLRCLPDPARHELPVELVVLMDVEVACVLALGLAGGDRTQRSRRAGTEVSQASYRPQVNDEREVFLDVLEKLVIHGDQLAPLPFCQGDVEAVMQTAPDR